MLLLFLAERGPQEAAKTAEELHWMLTLGEKNYQYNKYFTKKL